MLSCAVLSLRGSDKPYVVCCNTSTVFFRLCERTCVLFDSNLFDLVLIYLVVLID